jgi:hypothetical protein
VDPSDLGSQCLSYQSNSLYVTVVPPAEMIKKLGPFVLSP